MEKNIVIELDKVTFLRGAKSILKSINWTTRQGEHWFIMGNNGSGKTTLMELLMGYLWPQKGSVSVLGKRYGKVYLQDLRREIGYVSPWIFKRMSDFIPVEDIVASGTDASVGYYGPIPPSLKKKINQKLQFFGCADLLKRKFGTLSSGQQFKVIMSRSLINNPSILIFDEPFSLLDIGSRLNMYRYIDLLGRQRGGPQLIMVTHHLDDITATFTHGLLIREGRIYRQGTKIEILDAGVLAGAFGIPDDVLSITTARKLKKYINERPLR